MAPTAEADDIPEVDVPLFLKGATRGKYHARYAAALAASGLDVSGPAGDEPTSGLRLSPSQATRMDAFLGRLQREWRPRAEKSTVAIWATTADERIALAGTGVLFAAGGTYFLVTAAHVVAAARREGRTMWLVDPDLPDPPMLQFHGRAVADAPADVLVWELPFDVVEGLPTRRFLPPYAVDGRRLRTGPGLYGLVGYLAAGTNLTSVGDRYRGPSEMASCVGTPYISDGSVNGSFDAAQQLCIGFGWPDQIRTNVGNPVPPVRFAGTSGCGIWHLYSPAMPASFWTPTFPALAGIQTHVNYQSGYIRGTRWWVVDRLIREGWPHLAPALSLEVPDPQPAGAG